MSECGSLPRDVWGLIFQHLPYPHLTKMLRVNKFFSAYVTPLLTRRPCITGICSRPFRQIDIPEKQLEDRYTECIDLVSFKFTEGNSHSITVCWRQWISSAFPPVDEVQGFEEVIDLRKLPRASVLAFVENAAGVSSCNLWEGKQTAVDCAGNSVKAYAGFLPGEEQPWRPNLHEVHSFNPRGELLQCTQYEGRILSVDISASGVIGVLFNHPNQGPRLYLY